MLSRRIGLLIVGAVLAGASAPHGAEILPYGAKWRYFVGSSDPSPGNPGAWRSAVGGDPSWTVASAPIGYANPPNAAAESTIVTQIPSSQEMAYSSIFVSGQFLVKNPTPGNVFTINVNVDDGCIAWVNGKEIGRYNVPDGDLAFNAWASSAIEPTLTSFTLVNDQGQVIAGTNTIAIQVLNANSSSSDLFFDAQVESDLDESAPTVASTDPQAGGRLGALTQIDVIFNENVTGVDASDLLINGIPATGVSSVSPREYIFTFPQPGTGTVAVAWSAVTQITDLAANAFTGGSWSYSLEAANNQAAVIISEFLTDNGHGIKDDDAQRSDWIELLNTSAGIANLDGWFLTDNQTNLTKWRLPAITLDAGKYLLIFASGKDRTNVDAPLHTNFKLEKSGGYLALVDAQTNVVSAFAPYPAQREDISYGRDAVSTALTGYLSTPTPGAVNVTSGAGFGSEVGFSVKGGVYTNSSLSLRITAPRGEIRYTTDGSVPGSASPLYTGPITVTSSIAIKARTFEAGLLPGPVGAESFTLVDSNVSAFNSNLPLLILSTGGKSVAANVAPGQGRTFATVTAIDTFRGRSSVLGDPEFVGDCELEVRGQTSSGFPKAPYNIEFQDAYRRDKNVGLFGLPEGSDWALYNPYSDKPFLQNFLAFELYGKMGHYSVRTRFVEVYLDTSGGKVTASDYVGLYILMEKIKIDKNRVEIEPLTPYTAREPDISGGYMFKKDKDSSGDRNFTTSGLSGFSSQLLKIHEPKPREVTTTQLNWLRNYLVQFEKALYSPNWKTATGTNHYSYYIDVDSFVDYHWIVEFAKQIDGYRLSNYFFKPRNGKVQMSPIWDWNLSFGNADYLDGENTSNWYWQLCSENDHIWLRRLMCGTTDSGGTTGDPDFNQRIIDRWSELRTNVLSSTNVIARVQEMAGILSEAADRDFQRWPRLGSYIWPNPPLYSQPTTYAGIIGSMTNWIKGRYAWIDSQFLPVPVPNLAEGIVRPGSTLSFSTGTGAVYYTLDGTDPRSPGGAVSAKAIRYSAPVAIQSNGKLFARRLNGTTWSGPTVRIYAVQRPSLAVSEIMFHPVSLPAGSLFGVDDFQFVEFANVGPTALSLQGITVSGGVQFRFLSGTLDPGAYVVVAKNAAAFQFRYGTNVSVAGEFTGTLSHSGDRIVVTGALGEPIADIDFKDAWYPIADGAGFSLVSRFEMTSGADLSDPSSWEASAVEGGSPGQTDSPVSTTIPHVLISEILVRPVLGNSQQIELQNASAADADISGWFLSDDLQNPRRFRVPAGTIIPRNGFVIFSSDQFNNPFLAADPFALDAGGEEVWLFSADANGRLTGYVHGYEFGAQRESASVGRYIDSLGEERLVVQQTQTLGQANAGPWEAPVVISEIMYHPPDVMINSFAWNDSESEFVELVNRSSQSVPLYDTNRPTNTWIVDGGIQFTFPPNISISANGILLLVNFDPTLDQTELAAFRAKYSVAPSVPLFGPYKGNLANDSDRVALLIPDTPFTSGSNAGKIPYVVEDEVEYSGHFPWNAGADGLGFSLARSDLSGFGNDPAKWIATRPTPGALDSTGELPVIVSQPKSQLVTVGQNTSLSVEATGPALSYHWFFKGQSLLSANGPVLNVPNVQTTNTGDYYVVVLGSKAAVTSDRAFLEVSVDSDGDGMPDQWEFAYGLNPYDPSDALLDSDADGVSNRDEYIAGTNPRSGASHLQVSASDANSPGIHFLAAPNRSYSVLYSDTLQNGTWKKLIDLPSNSKGNEATVTDQGSAGQRYYKVVTPAQ